MQWVTRAKIAELAGVSRSALTQAVTGRLKPACMGKGRALQIDFEHYLVQDYIAEKRRNAATATGQKSARVTTNVPKVSSPDNGMISLENETGEVINLEELTVREIALKYGGVAQFAPYVKALKDIADYKNKEQTHLVKRGELIERETTAAALFMLVDMAYKRLVTEMPDAIMQRLVPLIQSAGEESEREGRQMLVDAVSKILKDCKTEVRKKLRALDKAGHD